MLPIEEIIEKEWFRVKNLDSLIRFTLSLLPPDEGGGKQTRKI